MGKSVLVVDDDSLSRRALAYSLRQSGYLVLEAASGESALDLIRSVDNFGVVIADLRLRGLADGLDVLKSQKEISPDSGLILVTAFGSSEVEREARGLGAEYLEKPISLTELASIVARMS